MSQGRRFTAVAINDEAIKDFRWQLQIRAWTYEDWAHGAGVSARVVSELMNGRNVEGRSLASLVAALKKYPPIEGLAELLRTEVSA